MDIKPGYFYHINDSFFTLVDDPSLMRNKEDDNYRPHYLALQDQNNHGIFWMVPVSSKYAKYQKIYNRQVAKYKKCTKIVLGQCGGKDAAFFIQNAFPVIGKYFDHIHTSQGGPLTLHTSTAKTIADCLYGNLRLHRRGISLFFADIDRIYSLMEKQLQS